MLFGLCATRSDFCRALQRSVKHTAAVLAKLPTLCFQCFFRTAFTSNAQRLGRWFGLESARSGDCLRNRTCLADCSRFGRAAQSLKYAEWLRGPYRLSVYHHAMPTHGRNEKLAALVVAWYLRAFSDAEIAKRADKLSDDLNWKVAMQRSVLEQLAGSGESLVSKPAE